MFKGRMGRGKYALTVLCLWVLQFLVMFLIGGLGLLSESLDSKVPLLWFICSIPIAVWGLHAACLRFHDIGKSGWTELLGLIPIYNIFLLVILFGRKGEEGENQYGPPL
jgi:uncharacterized membrane protein YhaH (DUF805 family)